ncbi:MAG TPA: TonB-dependent receptor [Methylococcaceae bacterium]|nr:TonB-dependent receptor [Methylococcaceae bacterium]HIA45657.1 TonB-dependent receptor [Methylococcaceae bacterium]HIB63331.1 TonB-dependent receptor [Methylococcaceae bacterium]HIN68482.1 TonB-dependent receptor [Methylococcales bacterium]HIO44111.1 TonB-dependent receptor [Methylococcales bacterium]
MNIKKAFLPLLIVPVSGVMADHTPTHQLDEMVITTSGKLFPETTIATPSFDITEEDIAKVNLTTAEDIVRGAPGIQVRRRFIGDTNGLVATRGSTNMQTAHTMMLQDGIPLSNLTQTKWNGAPRWTQIAPNSVESVKVFYGPFSAQHSGGSFGSVIEVKTKMPDEFEMHMDATGFMQESDRYGRDETLWGHKEFISAGDRFGDFTISGSFNHIENQGQPQMWDAQTPTTLLEQEQELVEGAYLKKADGTPDYDADGRLQALVWDDGGDAAADAANAEQFKALKYGQLKDKAAYIEDRTNMRAQFDPVTPIPVTGLPTAKNTKGEDTIITGDSGIEEMMNDLYSVKIGYDFTDSLRALFNVNFEDYQGKRGVEDLGARNYLAGQGVWGRGNATDTNSGDVVSYGGALYMPTKRGWGASRYAFSESERQTLSYGLNLSGQVNDDWSIDTSASFFDAFKDLAYKPDYSTLDDNDYLDWKGDRENYKGNIVDKEMWWATFDFKLATDHFLGDENLGFMWGYQYHQADLNTTTWKADSSSYKVKKATGGLKQDSGGETQLHSGFAQLDYDFLGDFNVMAGARLDVWSASGGHDLSNSWDPNQSYDRTFSDREQTRVSPKASISWAPNEFSARYSFSRAYRFALAQELFENQSAGASAVVSNPELGPESGNFHNLTLAYEIPEGLMSVDFFYNTIDNEIMNSAKVVDGQNLETFLGIGQTETIGVQMVYKQDNLFDLPLDLNLNGTWLDKQIVSNPDRPELVGKQWVRTSNWKANGSATYHLTDQWDTTLSANYRGPQYAEEDNSDNTSGVYGASDEYVLLNVKTQYVQPLANDMTATFSMGVDNLLNENYYDFHPYPQRTYFANVSLDI